MIIIVIMKVRDLKFGLRQLRILKKEKSSHVIMGLDMTKTINSFLVNVDQKIAVAI